MLRAGRDRMTDRGLLRGLEYCSACQSLRSRTQFRPVTIAFGLRTSRPHAALREMLRVRKSRQARGWSLAVPRVVKPLYDFHSFEVLARLGRLFANDATAIAISPSRSAASPQEELKAMMSRRLRALRL